MIKNLYHIGAYFLLLKRTFKLPSKKAILGRQLLKEISKLGVGSWGLVAIISIFMGAVITLQTATNFESPLIPRHLIGYATIQTLILELSSTIISLILAGKVGSNISSEIGTMRVTEQIDALEIMGVNSASYLILPKILGCMFIFPFLVLYSMFFGTIGGWIITLTTGVITNYEYIYGIQLDFEPYYIIYALIKTVVFAFIIATIPAYHGYNTKGGALEVGIASTKGVVYTSVSILVSNLVLTSILL